MAVRSSYAHTLFAKESTAEPSLSQEVSSLSKEGEEYPFRESLEDDNRQLSRYERKRDDEDEDYTPTPTQSSSASTPCSSQNTRRESSYSRASIPRSSYCPSDTDMGDGSGNEPSEEEDGNKDEDEDEDEDGDKDDMPYAASQAARFIAENTGLHAAAANNLDQRGAFPSDKLDGTKILLIAQVRNIVNAARFKDTKATIRILYELTQDEVEKVWRFCVDNAELLEEGRDAVYIEQVAREEWRFLLDPRM